MPSKLMLAALLMAALGGGCGGGTKFPSYDSCKKSCSGECYTFTEDGYDGAGRALYTCH